MATPIGHLGDLSPRAQAIFQHVAWIASEDTRRSGILCQAFGIDTPLISYHAHNECERVRHLIPRLLQGEKGALVTDAGTPLISDPGIALVSAAHAHGISVIPIPGPCAAIAALSVSGFPGKHFWFEGFLPLKGGRKKRLAALKPFPGSVILYEAPHRLQALLMDAVAVFGEEQEACVARELTKKHESVYKATCQRLLDWISTGKIPMRGECVVVIGPRKESALSALSEEAEHTLRVLFEALPLKQAVALAAEVTGLPKNQLYEQALAWRKG